MMVHLLKLIPSQWKKKHEKFVKTIKDKLANLKKPNEYADIIMKGNPS